MCHAFHFTTWETYKHIQQVGLKVSPLSDRHCKPLAIVQDYIKDGIIWLYKNRLETHKLLGMLLYVSINHPSDIIVRLRVDYKLYQAASWQALQDLCDPDALEVAFKHDFYFGQYGHVDEPIELVTENIPADKIHLDGQWNLLQVLTPL